MSSASPADAFKVISGKEAKAGSWMICNLDSKKKVEVFAQGVGLGDLKTKFPELEDKVAWVGFNVHGVDERANVQSTRFKLVQINWVGPKVTSMKKMNALAGKSKIAKVFKGMAATFDIDSVEDLTVKSISSKLLAAGGAHKPTYYLFGSAEDEKFALEFYDPANK
mmetsp:Transcript_947/g.2124  ORF Transcript_947/g.2124 Transcript_947/m.2124 type:complete len:166 (+) Transcript_947:31-528(+)